MSKILFFGDIIGKPGRQAVLAELPGLLEMHKPDLVIANVENLAHGKGVTNVTMSELARAGVDVFTSGNHVFDNLPEAVSCFEKYPTFIRPANYLSLPVKGAVPDVLPACPGRGYTRVEKNGQSYLIINLNGQVFFDKQFPKGMGNPFFTFDGILESEAKENDIIFVDLHAEATSEKQAFGFYADGRAVAVVGTHTHTPTQDFRVLPKGTGYVTDVGLNGPLNSVIGVKIENSLNLFLERGKFVMEPEEQGPKVVNAILFELEGSKTTRVEKINKVI
jgi:metallophosphoesterase (TIGR00282 family)